jgi:serine/threonine protein phosphatase PrpC
MLTEDHRLTIKSERDRIMAMGIKLENGQTRLNGLAVSRALGDHFPKETNCGLIAEPYISETIKIEPTDSHIIIASDGVRIFRERERERLSKRNQSYSRFLLCFSLSFLLVHSLSKLWDVVTGQHAYEIIAELSSAEEMASTLLNTALRSSKCTDNVTVIVVKL